MNKFLNYVESIGVVHFYPTHPNLVMVFIASRCRIVKPDTVRGDVSAITHYNKLSGNFRNYSQLPVINDFLSRINKIYGQQKNDTRLPFLLYHILTICDYYKVNIDTMWNCDLTTLGHITILVISCFVGNRQFELSPYVQRPKVYENGVRWGDIKIVTKFKNGGDLPSHLIHTEMIVRDKSSKHLMGTKRHVFGKSGGKICPCLFLWTFMQRLRSKKLSKVNNKYKIGKWDYIFQSDNGTPITTKKQCKFLKVTSELLKFEEFWRYKGHSCKESAATMLARRGKSDSFIIQFIKWAAKSSSMYRYTRISDWEFIGVSKFILETSVTDENVIWDPSVVRFGSTLNNKL
eukprot:175016_1